jgi:hypothetical protein
MKISKSELKSLMKECIREVLQEEKFVSKLQEAISVNKVSLPVNKKSTELLTNKTTTVAKKVAEIETEDNINPSLSEAVKTLTNSFRGKDADMMRKIFEDTAVTTLQEQLSQPDMSSGMPMNLSEATLGSGVEKVNSEDIKSLAMNGDVSRWAKIALANKKN